MVRRPPINCRMDSERARTTGTCCALCTSFDAQHIVVVSSGERRATTREPGRKHRRRGRRHRRVRVHRTQLRHTNAACRTSSVCFSPATCVHTYFKQSRKHCGAPCILRRINMTKIRLRCGAIQVTSSLTARRWRWCCWWCQAPLK